MENVPPPNNNPNVPEEEPILDQALASLVGFAPQWIGGKIPHNNNGWLENDPDEDEEEDLEEEPKEEEIKDEDMVNNEEDNTEVINPYEEADPYNRPPPISDEETEFAPPVVQIADVDDVPIPPVIQFGLCKRKNTQQLTIPGGAFYLPAPVPRVDDPYVMVRDAATDTQGGEDVDTDAPWDTQPYEPRGSPPAIRTERERVRMEATRARGAVGLVHSFKKMENTFEISREVANGRPWTEVKQVMTDEFCPTEEVKRLEDELRHLKLRDMNIAAYTERFNELALLCPDVVPNEKKKVELYIKGLSKIIKGNNNNNNSHNRGNYRNNNHHNQNNNRRQNNVRDLTTAQNAGVNQTGIALKCNCRGRCHFDQCPPKCDNCGRMGHKAKDCQSKNMASGQAYVIRDAEHNQGLNVVTVEFKIKLIPGAAPVARTPYRLAPSKLKEFSDQLKGFLEKGFIRPSSSPWIDDLFDQLQGSSVYSKIDLRFGYHQLRIREKDIPITAFQTRYSHFKFQVMSFRLTNAPTVFMDLMNRVCKLYMDKFVIVFIDDIIIYSKNKEDHEKHLKTILELLKNEKLYAKFSKCDFWLKSVQSLSHVIDSNGVHVDPAKKNKKYEWGMEEEEAFQTLK
uniref:Putative reverse transcriptase domain-containing protein n=1 Tax=Tanacetum cinerariifolium TaxID=118510 RepID=A0A6L2JVW0_TANCI|nr:putative reverse transcriptase domain-containing protein [Tanacetum cinerariifolium]